MERPSRASCGAHGVGTKGWPDFMRTGRLGIGEPEIAQVARIQRLLRIGALLVLAVPALAETTFQITVVKGGKETGTGVGVAVAEGLLLTTERFVTRVDGLLVNDPSTSARIEASIKASDKDAQLALIEAPGLAVETPKLASEAPATGRRVDLSLVDGTRREGALHSIVTDKDGRVRYRFTAIPTEQEAGAPLLNNCGELVAISDFRPKGKVPKEDQNLGSSGDLETLKAFLTAQGVEIQIADAACPSLADQLSKSEEAGKELEEAKAALEAERDKVTEEKAALEKQIAEIEAASTEQQQQSQEQVEALEARKAELEAQKVEIEERLQKRSADVAAKQREIDAHVAARQDLEEQIAQGEAELQRQEEEFAQERTAQEERERTQWMIGGAIGMLILLGLALMGARLRSRKRQIDESNVALEDARSQLEMSNVSFPDMILVGKGPQGETLRIKIDGTAVARSEGGQIIGRSSADAKYVIAVDSVSRHHARLKVDGGELTIEDLGSMNGTTLDGEKLVKGQPRAVRRGARIGLGDVEFDTQFLQEKD